MPTESNTNFGLVISGVGRGVNGGEGMGVCSLRSQNISPACGLMLKKKLLPLMIELVVILNHLGAIHL